MITCQISCVCVLDTFQRTIIMCHTAFYSFKLLFPFVSRHSPHFLITFYIVSTLVLLLLLLCQTFKSACIFDGVSIKCTAQVFEFTSIPSCSPSVWRRCEITQHRNFVVNELDSFLLSAAFHPSVTPYRCPVHPQLNYSYSVMFMPVVVCVDEPTKYRGRLVLNRAFRQSVKHQAVGQSVLCLHLIQ